jgi:uncharacterized membrane protein
MTSVRQSVTVVGGGVRLMVNVLFEFSSKIIWAKGTFVPTFGSALINVGKMVEALVERISPCHLEATLM